ncbi:protein tyrosine phosphatase domain-containing protein 1 isoform X2 [Stegostoma tigrinum]|uniref:protein tyrosine phosphatase domain-containing protein 1 isoform X2 n=1 Tax=Stegostoma tigrinum TaxID=3053191 RepID=UPI00202B97C7|nr:protein tyrosine phosphatase domain-containing protein 1 isoform X2 [Stegostoma tigrinum]
MTLQIPNPRPSYSQTRELLIKAVPPHLICSLVCGGKECRYEGPGEWTLQQQAIRGVFSAWVTDDILAMARPSTQLIKKFNIIKQFQGLNIKSVINLQVPGEHDHCGDPLELKSGFSYLPETFMENNIYFFNFGMADFGVSSLVRVLDAVKVTSFAIQEGKVAVHCHAGLGRTGVLIACYLVYATRVSPGEAIHFVRIKRPCSIQTRTQINLVYDFAQFVDSHRTMFTDVSLHAHPITLKQYLYRQQYLLHGYEARHLKHVPKIVDFICKRLLQIAFDKDDSSMVQLEVQREVIDRTLTLYIRETITSFINSPEFLLANQEPEDPDNSLRPPTSAAGLFDQASLPGWDAKAQPRMMPRLLRTVSDSNLPGIISTYQTQGTCTQQPLPMGQRRAAALELVFSGPTNPVKRSFSYEGRENLVRDRNMVQTDHVAGFKLARHGNSLLTNTDLLSTTSTKSNVHWRKSVKESSRKMNKHGHLLEEVARAMSEGSPTDNDFLVKVRLWKMELNENEGAWGRLTAEHDPRVLSMLMWSWLEHLKKPVLCSEDVVTLLSNHAVKGTPWDLEKCQEGTINCILDCISKFTGLPSTLEDSIIHRMILALTQSCEEDVLHFTALLQKLKMIIREKRSHYIFNKGVAKTKMLKISLHGEESK